MTSGGGPGPGWAVAGDAGAGRRLRQWPVLRGLRDRGVAVVGCDLLMGMLRAAAHPALLNADITALPPRDGAVDVVFAVHVLYHVPSREAPAGSRAGSWPRAAPVSL